MPGNAPAATRALAVLRALAEAPAPMTASALGRQLDVPRSSMYHLLAAMAEAGFVAHYPEEERWGLGVGAFEIGAAYLRHEPLERYGRPLLHRLAHAVADVVPAVAHLGVLHGRETLYLLREAPRTPVTVVADVGRATAGEPDRLGSSAARAVAGRAGASAVPLQGILRRPDGSRADHRDRAVEDPGGGAAAGMG